jgi:rod shape determining protein RodA
MVATLLLIFLFGSVVKGAQSWFHIGGLALQPSDPAKLVLILILAKYFSRRHVEIAHARHIFVSGAYAAVLFLLVFFQPDFGSAIIIFFIWLGMVLVSGISKRHLIAILLTGALTFAGLWLYGFADYQKQRILTFIHPYTDLQGSGYNAYQATIAIGSGGLLGKGVGYGTQSKLRFLPEYETDFIFSAFAEEWGFVGIMLLFLLYGIVFWRVVAAALSGETNFEILFGAGVGVLILSHFVIHIGMNIGLLPVTGTTVPFMSYGGSHLITEFTALGILMGMRRHARSAHKEDVRREFLSV